MSLISDALKEAQKKRDSLKEKELLDIRTREIKKRGQSFLIKGVIISFFLLLLAFLPFFLLKGNKGVKHSERVRVGKKVIAENRVKVDTLQKRGESIVSKKTNVKKESPKGNNLTSVDKEEAHKKNLKDERFIIKKTKSKKIEQSAKVEKKKKVKGKGKLKREGVKEDISKRVLVKKPDSESPFEKARKFLNSGETDKAIEILKEIISKNPSDPEILFELGTAFLLKKEYYTAYTYFERALALAPNNEQLIFNTAISLFKMGKIEEAKTLWLRLYKINRNFPELYYFLGISEDLTKNYNKAKYYYKEYLKEGTNGELKAWVIKRLSQL